MPPPSPADYATRIKAILQSVQLLPDEAKAPILHYRRAVADVWGSLGYVERSPGDGRLAGGWFQTPPRGRRGDGRCACRLIGKALEQNEVPPSSKKKGSCATW
jgi:hypothetical protein